MANANPHYHSWIFRRPASGNLLPRVQIAYAEDGEPHIVIEDRAQLDRHLENRRRIEILEEARLLKRNLTDLW